MKRFDFWKSKDLRKIWFLLSARFAESILHWTTSIPRSKSTDIQCVTVSGLGKGKGFAVTDRGSIFDAGYRNDLTIHAIAMRTLVILRMLKDNQVLTDGDIIREVGLQWPGFG